MDREKEILKVYKNEGIDGLKRLNATNDEINQIGMVLAEYRRK